MDHVQELGKLIDKVRPLQEAKKSKQDDVIKALARKPADSRVIEHNGRVYRLKYTASKPPINKKFIDEVIKMYNAEKSNAIAEDFMSYIISVQEQRKKEPKPRLAISNS